MVLLVRRFNNLCDSPLGFLEESIIENDRNGSLWTETGQFYVMLNFLKVQSGATAASGVANGAFLMQTTKTNNAYVGDGVGKVEQNGPPIISGNQHPSIASNKALLKSLPFRGKKVMKEEIFSLENIIEHQEIEANALSQAIRFEMTNGRPSLEDLTQFLSDDEIDTIWDDLDYIYGKGWREKPIATEMVELVEVVVV